MTDDTLPSWVYALIIVAGFVVSLAIVCFLARNDKS